MLIIKNVRWKNFLGTGNQFLEVDLTKSERTLVIGENGSGKCLLPTTEVDVIIEDPNIRKQFEEFLDSDT